MKNFNFIKVAVFSLLLFLSSNLYASKFVLSDDGLIDQRAIGKIDEIGNETFSKLGVNIYVYAKSTLGLDANISTKDKIKYIKEYESNIISNLAEPYVLLSMAVEDTHVNLIVSSSLKNVVDKNEILNSYVVPLLASKDKNSTFAKASAAILNGYAAIADTVAESKNIKLESSIGSSGKVAGTVWKVFMYSLIVAGLLLYVYAVLRRKK
ncbi:hypothetical protein [Halarcobacter bivalviorum]|uniref:Membrane protein n=1 Tax=Halarcobacter bivalviorum TaxID=663364 RepID=A0AAX2AAR2_9BACT|nr:hypothetical protein [Halarcobacter bivalviorum]AXH13215.1 putative membrane protein [Halarcobacter bivalviorum]RXK10178.1 hypothetical protein CRV05_07300 [Halarcobacter bivalviorum]